MSIEQRIYEGNRAAEVLENEAFVNAMAAIKQEITEQWMNSPARDEEGRERLWTMLKIAQKFELILENTLSTGKLAKQDLEHQRSMAQRAKDFLGMS